MQGIQPYLLEKNFGAKLNIFGQIWLDLDKIKSRIPLNVRSPTAMCWRGYSLIDLCHSFF